MAKIKDENFVQIQGWMINRLKLKGNDLIVYAVIYGFTQDGQNWFEGSRQYLADWCSCSLAGVQKNLKSLVEKNLIIKEDVVINKVKFCKYKANLQCLEVENNVATPSKQSLLPQSTEFTTPSKLSLLNNIDNKINKNINNNISKKESKKSFDELIDEYTNNEELREELRNHLQTRKTKKAALTNRAIELSFKKLDDLVRNVPINMQDETKIKIVQRSIENGWTTFYPLKENNYGYNQNNYFKKKNDGLNDILNENIINIVNKAF